MTGLKVVTTGLLVVVPVDTVVVTSGFLVVDVGIGCIPVRDGTDKEQKPQRLVLEEYGLYEGPHTGFHKPDNIPHDNTIVLVLN